MSIRTSTPGSAAVPVQAVPDSPIPASQIDGMNLDALLAESVRLAEVKGYVR